MLWLQDLRAVCSSGCACSCAGSRRLGEYADARTSVTDLPVPTGGKSGGAGGTGLTLFENGVSGGHSQPMVCAEFFSAWWRNEKNKDTVVSSESNVFN